MISAGIYNMTDDELVKHFERVLQEAADRNLELSNGLFYEPDIKLAARFVTYLRTVNKGPVGAGKRQLRCYEILLRNPKAVISTGQMHDFIYQDDPHGGPTSKTIHVMISRMRQAMEPTPFTIETVWGMGYKLANKEDEEEGVPNFLRPLSKEKV